MNRIAIIPARGGSKRIPRKNIRSFLGKPIIAYSIEVALKSGLFNEVMVSTDDKEIAKIAKKYGASVPFLRSIENSNDYATTVDVLKEVLNKYAESGNCFNQACCIYPTAPLVTSDALLNTYDKLIIGGWDCVFPVVEFSYPIQRSLIFNGDRIKMKWPENKWKRSQDLERAYHDAGQYYWFDVREFEKNENLWTDNTSSVVVSELNVQDIDNESDWKIAELKYQLINQ